MNGLKHILIGSLVDGLPGILIQRRFRIEALHLAHSTDQEYPDDTLGFRSKVRQAGGRRPRMLGTLSNRVVMQHRTEDQPGKSHTYVRQKSSTRCGRAATGLASSAS